MKTKRTINGTIYNPDDYGPKADPVPQNSFFESLKNELRDRYIAGNHGELPQGPTYLEKKGVQLTNLPGQRPSAVGSSIPWSSRGNR